MDCILESDSAGDTVCKQYLVFVFTFLMPSPLLFSSLSCYILLEKRCIIYWEIKGHFCIWFFLRKSKSPTEITRPEKSSAENQKIKAICDGGRGNVSLSLKRYLKTYTILNIVQTMKMGVIAEEFSRPFWRIVRGIWGLFYRLIDDPKWLLSAI